MWNGTSRCDLREQGLPEPLQLSGTDHCIVLSFKGADSGGSSSGNGSGVAPAAPAGGSRSSSRNLGSSGGEKEEGKKVRRQWESWSTEDKNTFFEGLYEVSELWSQKRQLKPLASYHFISLSVFLHHSYHIATRSIG